MDSLAARELASDSTSMMIPRRLCSVAQCSTSTCRARSVPGLFGEHVLYCLNLAAVDTVPTGGPRPNTRNFAPRGPGLKIYLIHRDV